MRTLRAALNARLNDAVPAAQPWFINVGSLSLDNFLQAVCDNFPFLRRLMLHDAARLDRVLDASPDDGFASLMPLAVLNEPINSAKIRLRMIRQDLALAVALCDLSALWSVEQVTELLSDFADRAVQQALDVSWVDLSTKYYESFTALTGLTIIAMGKHGARELNYSSDIDLVAIYDPERLMAPENGRLDAKGIAVKLVQSMVDILSQQTEHGFVFRTDLRLRPNPGATPVAVSLAAADTYYQVYGQNWERAAFIKARYCAGDEIVGAAFYDLINSFVWRRALDYGAVADIHAVKKQIHSQKGSPELAVVGGDIKLGPGGIREIEFFAQMQQLLLGGRDIKLRAPRTLEAIEALCGEGHVTKVTGAGLAAAYRFFRNLEHRIQMREDAQTHTVSEDLHALEAIAISMGFSDIDAFEHATLQHLNFVHDAYADLFGTPQSDELVSRSLVFTGVDDDPRTLKTLREMGFGVPEFVTARIRQWHQGGLRATRSVRARELLTALVPRILEQVGSLDDPDTAFKALESFLRELPGGFQVFALFTAEPNILDDVLLLCSAAPALVRALGRKPNLVEGLLEGFSTAAVEFTALPETANIEDYLDEVRRVVNEHRTRVSVGLVLGRCDGIEVGLHLSEMAERALSVLIKQVAIDSGLDPNIVQRELAVLAFGRFGARALTPHSDLDLVFVYRSLGEENGEQQFSRLIRRIVSALSVPTAEGELFSIDMKLRPSGGAGPAAVGFTSFAKYYAETAWTWEHMALTKARIVFGSGTLVRDVDNVIERTIRMPREPSSLTNDVVSMRRRLLAEKPGRGALDVKRVAGGITDIEFVIQYLKLLHGAELGRIGPGTVESIFLLQRAGHLSADDAEMLRQNYCVAERVIQGLRATFGLTPPKELPAESERMLIEMVMPGSLMNMATLLNGQFRDTRQVFKRLVGISPYTEENDPG